MLEVKNVLCLCLYFVAMNGHTECLRLLMETADDSNIVDVSDSLDRYTTTL